MGLRVRELSYILSNLDQELQVVVDGYEGGTKPLEKEYIRIQFVDTSDKQDFFGEYGNPENTSEGMETPLLVLILGRSWD